MLLSVLTDLEKAKFRYAERMTEKVLITVLMQGVIDIYVLSN